MTSSTTKHHKEIPCLKYMTLCLPSSNKFLLLTHRMPLPHCHSSLSGPSVLTLAKSVERVLKGRISSSLVLKNTALNVGRDSRKKSARKKPPTRNLP